MRIIHCADLHLDSKMNANLPGDKAKERKAELLQTFYRMISFAKEHGVSAVLIAGDLFDTKNVSAAARNVVKAAITDNPEIDFFYLRGNHDADSFLSRLDEFPTNLKLFDNVWKSYEIELRCKRKVVISGMELDKDNAGSACNSLVLKQEDYNIVMLHGQESVHDNKNKAETVFIGGFRNKNIDYLALGHIHSYKESPLDARGTYCYPGCLEARGFDECGEHGFIYMDIDEDTGKLAERRLVSIERRKHHDISVEISGCPTSAGVLDEIRSVLKTQRISSQDILKIRLVGKMSMEAEVDCDYLLKSLENDYYYVKVVNQLGVDIDYVMYSKDESLKGEFVRKVMLDSGLSKDEQEMVISMGLRLLNGEEV